LVKGQNMSFPMGAPNARKTLGFRTGGSQQVIGSGVGNKRKGQLNARNRGGLVESPKLFSTTK